MCLPRGATHHRESGESGKGARVQVAVCVCVSVCPCGSVPDEMFVLIR